jgi:hypothetical protein
MVIISCDEAGEQVDEADETEAVAPVEPPELLEINEVTDDRMRLIILPADEGVDE